jgi:hypothetical protein
MEFVKVAVIVAFAVPKVKFAELALTEDIEPPPASFITQAKNP